MKLNKSDLELIEMAKQVVAENKDIANMMGIVIASVVKGKSGKFYKGINIKTSHSICAEQVAIGQALACGERELDTIVAVKLEKNGGYRVVSPCGLCRYTMDKLGLWNLNVIIEDIKKNEVLKVKSPELLPYPYARNKNRKNENE